MVNSFTVFGLFFLVLLFLNAYLFGDDDLLSGILGFFSVAAMFNVFLMNRNREAGRIGLTAINYSLAILLLYTGGHESTGMLWCYLLVAVGIFINSFRNGLILNSMFLLITAVILMVGYELGLSRVEYGDVISVRVVITLVALSGMCHILIFFQGRADQQILDMHEGGIASLAYLDSLTMLSNRVTFRSVLYHEIQLGSTRYTGLIYIDLDNFKLINDEYNHDFGDEVLAEYATQLKRTVFTVLGEDKVREYDVGRLGGDEFAVFIRDASDEAKVKALAEEILAITAQKQLKALEKVKHNLGSSLGVVVVDTKHFDLIESLSVADKGMYQAKKAGKGKIRYVSLSGSIEAPQQVAEAV